MPHACTVLFEFVSMERQHISFRASWFASALRCHAWDILQHHNANSYCGNDPSGVSFSYTPLIIEHPSVYPGQALGVYLLFLLFLSSI